jgi:hypothetical protein
MLNRYIILLFFILNGTIQTCAQISFVKDTLAKKLGISAAIKKTYFNNDTISSMIYTEFYDKNGRLTIRKSFNNHLKTVVINEFFFYNNKAQLIEERSVNYNFKDSIYHTQIYTYNTKGQLANNLYGKINYKYDKKGRVIEQIEKTAKLGNFKTTFFHDSLGQLAFKEEYTHNVLEKKTLYTYNNKKQITTEMYLYYDNEQSVPSSEYQNSYIYNEAGLITIEYQKQLKKLPETKLENRKYTYEYLYY